YLSVRPMLAVSGGRIIGLSTPFGSRGWFHAEWSDGGPGWERIMVRAQDCPRISRDFLAEERQALGDWWYSQEYDCRFMDATDSVFKFDDVMAAIDDSIAPLFA